jgi:hypothetical protein
MDGNHYFFKTMNLKNNNTMNNPNGHHIDSLHCIMLCVTLRGPVILIRRPAADAGADGGGRKIRSRH